MRWADVSPALVADQPRRPQPRRSMRWADVYVCMLADGVALRHRCPRGQADPRASIAGGASGDPESTDQPGDGRRAFHGRLGVIKAVLVEELAARFMMPKREAAIVGDGVSSWQPSMPRPGRRRRRCRR